MVIATTDMTDLAVPAAPPVKVGPNSYSVSASITGDFVFIEMIIEATGADGKQFTTAAGFIPYRKLDRRHGDAPPDASEDRGHGVYKPDQQSAALSNAEMSKRVR
jgi:hypothetical protein